MISFSSFLLCPPQKVHLHMDQNKLADLIASKFIARKEVKAVQRMLPNGDCIYTPHTRGPAGDKDYLPWSRVSLLMHLESKRSFGHYLLDTNDNCKFFAFDIDLEKTGSYPTDFGKADYWDTVTACNPREDWKNRKHPARPWLKYQLRMIAGLCASAIHSELDIPVAAYYSGNKGVHVYGLTGLIPAFEARLGAKIVLESMGIWEAVRGDIFYKTKDQDPITGYPNISLELFPKQDTIGDKSGLGNLMRVPLGTNLKNPKDPTFFVDLSNTNMTQLVPIDAVTALTSSNAWAGA